MQYPTLYPNTCERQAVDPNLWIPSVFKTTGQKEKEKSLKECDLPLLDMREDSYLFEMECVNPLSSTVDVQYP